MEVKRIAEEWEIWDEEEEAVKVRGRSEEVSSRTIS